MGSFITPLPFLREETMSNYNYSFNQWCEDNNREDLIERWDNFLNQCSPSDVSFKSNNKYFFKCPREIHESESACLYDISGGKNKSVKCKKCSSFAQHIIDTYGEEYLNQIWDNSNTISPWEVSAHSKKPFYFVCENDSAHVFPQTLDHYVNGIKCPYCSHRKILPRNNSLGVSNPEVLDVWSDTNTDSPYDYAPCSGQEVWWKCENGVHDDYKRKISSSQTRNFKCPICARNNIKPRQKTNLTNQTFGELTALYIDKAKTKKTLKTHWVCKCSCGNTTVTTAYGLMNGKVKTCGNRTIHFSKENNGNWQGGKTPELLSARTSKKYNTWRDGVYKKDWYTCQCCGKSHGINKEAHHLKNFSDNTSLRYDVDNGILLCDQCHSAIIPGSFHYIYGTVNNTPEQLEEYINNRRKELGMDIPFFISEYLKGKCLKPDDERKTYVT